MAYIILFLGIVIFIIAGIQQWPALALIAVFLSISVMLLGGRPASRWVRIHSFIRHERRVFRQRSRRDFRRARKVPSQTSRENEMTSDDFIS